MPVPIVSVDQMRKWEQATWAAGQTEAEVIRLVGVRLAAQVLRMTRPGELILLLAGKGNNGADARATREHLNDRQVELLDVSDPAVDLAKLEDGLKRRPKLVIDGLFGIGLNRPLGAEWVQFISRLNEARVPVLAVDVPSGLNAETGETEGAAVEAAVTLTLGAPKQGMLKETAWRYVGRLEVADHVGLVPCPITRELQWTLPNDFEGYPPARAPASHKGTY